MRMVLMLLVIVSCLACSNRGVISDSADQVWLEDQAYQLNNGGQLGAYIVAMLNRQEIIVDQARTETTADEEGHQYRAVVRTYMQNGTLQSVIIPIEKTDPTRWVGECAMFCDCAGDCSSCVIRVIEKCRQLSGVCTSGKGGADIGVVVKDGKP
ncbi:MAG: hypothetical protein KDC28_11040 [Saprospiraceae bacterium]|nr:hypothetical protein [Saprospiraceae bacterium]MCB9321095.1 hypothetical protein [Lewinellaceae bacterium]